MSDRGFRADYKVPADIFLKMRTFMHYLDDCCNIEPEAQDDLRTLLDFMDNKVLARCQRARYAAGKGYEKRN